MKKIVSLMMIISVFMLSFCGCDISSPDSGETKETEPPKYVDTLIIVNYDHTFGEWLFGNSEEFEITLDGETIGSISFKHNEPIKAECSLTEGIHTLSAKGSEDSKYNFNTVTFNVKYTEGIYSAEFEMDNSNLELIETHISEPPAESTANTDNTNTYDTNDEEEISETVIMEDLVEVKVNVAGSLSLIPDILAGEYQPFTVYVDGIEIGRLSKGGDDVSKTLLLPKGMHKVSIRKNNTDTLDTDSKSFLVTDLTDKVSYSISHYQLLGTYELEEVK